MRDPFRRYFARQRRSLTNAYKGIEPFSLSAISAERLWALARDWRWRVVPLVGTRQNNALVVEKQPGALPELWVRPGYHCYRRAFEKYLAQYHGFPRAARIPRSWHVDHLCSRMLFKGRPEEYYLRAVLLRPAYNTSFGAGYERMRFARERAQGTLRDTYAVDSITFLKVRGVRLPSSGASLEARGAWAERTARMLQQRGIEPIDLAFDEMTQRLAMSWSGEREPLPRTEGVVEVLRAEQQAWEAAPKVYAAVEERQCVPVLLGVYATFGEAIEAAESRAPELPWRSRGTGEYSAWDDSVHPYVEYRVLPARRDSDDLDAIGERVMQRLGRRGVAQG